MKQHGTAKIFSGLSVIHLVLSNFLGISLFMKVIIAVLLVLLFFKEKRSLFLALWLCILYTRMWICLNFTYNTTGNMLTFIDSALSLVRRIESLSNAS